MGEIVSFKFCNLFKKKNPQSSRESDMKWVILEIFGLCRAQTVMLYHSFGRHCFVVAC